MGERASPSELLIATGVVDAILASLGGVSWDLCLIWGLTSSSFLCSLDADVSPNLAQGGDTSGQDEEEEEEEEGASGELKAGSGPVPSLS